MREVSSKNLFAYHYNLGLQSLLREICQPLFDVTPITSFRYGRVLDAETYIYLGTHEEGSYYNLLECPIISSTFLEAIKRAEKDTFYYHLWPRSQADDCLEKYYTLNIWNGLTVYRRTDQVIEAWCFNSTRENTQTDQFYINRRFFLRDFIRYFNKRFFLTREPFPIQAYAHFYSPLKIGSSAKEQEEKEKLEKFHKKLLMELEDHKRCFSSLDWTSSDISRIYYPKRIL